ncbi:MAG: signal transduction histidine kinase [Candidatus Midichloriaceae bacterium]|jgi:signal transduction histidine kinase
MKKRNEIKEYSLESFAQSIAHDVTSPLATNVMSLELIEMALDNKEYDEIRGYVSRMREYNKSAMQDVQIILNAIGDVKDIEDCGEYSVVKCIGGAIQGFYMNKEQRDRIFFDDSNDYLFSGSEILFRHIIFNLLHNFFKYSGNTSILKIYIKNNKIHLKDDGYGIKPDILNHLFEKHVSSTYNAIGLSFCKEAIGKMDGDITCISDEGKGSEFIISFN